MSDPKPANFDWVDRQNQPDSAQAPPPAAGAESGLSFELDAESQAIASGDATSAAPSRQRQTTEFEEVEGEESRQMQRQILDVMQEQNQILLELPQLIVEALRNG